jgi:outer membrane protein assembly factor BamE
MANSASSLLRNVRFSVLHGMLITTLGLGGCTSLQTSDSFMGFITPYKVEVVQGNVMTQEQAEAVKAGMSRAQVREILGTPLVADTFHADRWDYVFTSRAKWL